MGIGLAIVSWCFKGTAIATVLAVLAGTLTATSIPHGNPRRTRLILWTCVYPFACFCWILAIVLFQAYINETRFYRDPGMGHVWQTPLPNGYAMLLIDEKHDGTVFDPKTHFSDSSNNDIHPDGPDAVSGVRVIQVAGDKILGGAGPLGQYSSSSARNRVDYYFLLDTTAHTRATFENYDALSRAARATGIEPNLRRFYTVYKHYRYTWFDFSALALALIPILAAGFVLIRRVWSIKRLSPSTVAPRELHRTS